MAMTLRQMGYISIIAGISSTASVIMGIIIKPVYENPDWRDIAFISALGGAIGSRYALKGFRRNY